MGRLWLVSRAQRHICERCSASFSLNSPLNSVESSFQNTTSVHSRGSNAVLKKVELDYRTHPPIGLERVFQRSTQWTHRLQRCQNRNRGCPEVTCNIGSAHSAKNDVEGLPRAGKHPLKLLMDSREGSINCFPESKDSHLLMT